MYKNNSWSSAAPTKRKWLAMPSLKKLLLVGIFVAVVLYLFTYYAGGSTFRYEFQDFHAKSYFSSKTYDCIKALNLSEDTISDLNDQQILKTKPIFVTAFSENHIEEATDNLDVFNELFPKEQIIIYHLGGLTDVEFFDFSYVGKSELRHFNFENYPPEVKRLGEFRWKPLIIAEVLAKHPAIWWMDISIKWDRKDLDQIYQAAKKLKYPFLLFDHTGHSTFAATNPLMFDYIPSNGDKLKTLEMLGAGLQLIYGTGAVKRDILRWLVACALEKDCMVPTASEPYCRFTKKDRYNDYGKCHRYDQSVLNVLLANANYFNLKNYAYNASSYYSVGRVDRWNMALKN